VDRYHKSGGINEHGGETGPRRSWPTASLERRSETDGAAGVAHRGALGGDWSEVCGELGSYVPLEGQPRSGAQGARRTGAEGLGGGRGKKHLRAQGTHMTRGDVR